MAARIQKILLLYTDKYYLIKPIYPYGLDLIARHLRRHGYDVTIGYPLLPDTDVLTNLKEQLQKAKPDLIGVGLRNLDTTMSCELFGNVRGPGYQAFFFLPDVRDIITTIQTLQPQTPLVVGGGAFTIAPEAILNYLGADFGIVGEGEHALLEFIQTHPDASKFRQIPNLVYKDGAALRCNPNRAYTFDHFKPFTRRALQFNYAYESAGLPVQTKRGCNQRCAYCVEPQIEGRKYIYRNPHDIIHELETLAANYPDVQSIFFVDTEFNLPDLNHCTHILKQIIASSLPQRFRFASQFLPMPFSAELADLLRQACFSIILTADSFADQVLEQNGLCFRQKDILKTLDLCEASGVDCTVNLIFGLPGETEDTLDRTLDMLDQYPPNSLRRYEYTCGARIYPGTPLHDWLDSSTHHGSHVYGALGSDYLEPCFYSAPMAPHTLKKYIDRRLPFTLDFQNDYDTVKHEVLGLGYLADLALWDDVITRFKASTLAAKADSYLYLVKKLAAGDHHLYARTILMHLAESITQEDNTGQYAETLPVAQYYLSLLSKS